MVPRHSFSLTLLRRTEISKNEPSGCHGHDCQQATGIRHRPFSLTPKFLESLPKERSKRAGNSQEIAIRPFHNGYRKGCGGTRAIHLHVFCDSRPKMLTIFCYSSLCYKKLKL